MVLYINGNYPHHSLHSELVMKLAELGNSITVFVPMKGNELEGKYSCNHPNVKIIYSDCLKTLDRVFFVNKIHRIVKEIEKHINIKDVDCILAGTMYSDGAVAYLLYEKYRIPYSIAIRHTDVTDHMRWRPYLNGFAKRLLNHATKIVFLTPAYEHYLDKFGKFQDKYAIIPNAVNDFWFHNSPQHKGIHKPVSLIFVGELSKNKNVSTSLLTVAELKKQSIFVEFHIVGNGVEEKNCRSLAKRLGVEDQVFFHGWINQKEKIKEIYDQSDIFIMLSHKESFGTVYIEALSQGLPVLYTKGQGIDGYFYDGNVGYGCHNNDLVEVTSNIIKIIDNYQIMSKQSIILSQMFTWDTVAQKYNDVLCCMREQ